MEEKSNINSSNVESKQSINNDTNEVVSTTNSSANAAASISNTATTESANARASIRVSDAAINALIASISAPSASAIVSTTNDTETESTTISSASAIVSTTNDNTAESSTSIVANNSETTTSTSTATTLDTAASESKSSAPIVDDTEKNFFNVLQDVPNMRKMIGENACFRIFNLMDDLDVICGRLNVMRVKELKILFKSLFHTFKHISSVFNYNYDNVLLRNGKISKFRKDTVMIAIKYMLKFKLSSTQANQALTLFHQSFLTYFKRKFTPLEGDIGPDRGFHCNFITRPPGTLGMKPYFHADGTFSIRDHAPMFVFNNRNNPRHGISLVQPKKINKVIPSTSNFFDKPLLLSQSFIKSHRIGQKPNRILYINPIKYAVYNNFYGKFELTDTERKKISRGKAEIQLRVVLKNGEPGNTQDIHMEIRQQFRTIRSTTYNTFLSKVHRLANKEKKPIQYSYVKIPSTMIKGAGIANEINIIVNLSRIHYEVGGPLAAVIEVVDVLSPEQIVENFLTTRLNDKLNQFIDIKTDNTDNTDKKDDNSITTESTDTNNENKNAACNFCGVRKPDLLRCSRCKKSTLL